MANASTLRGKAKARQLLALIEAQKVLVFRVGGTLRLPLKELVTGDAFRYQDEWFYVGEREIRHIPCSKAA